MDKVVTDLDTNKYSTVQLNKTQIIHFKVTHRKTYLEGWIQFLAGTLQLVIPFAGEHTHLVAIAMGHS
jgi:hypothetical protein